VPAIHTQIFKLFGFHERGVERQVVPDPCAAATFFLAGVFPDLVDVTLQQIRVKPVAGHQTLGNVLAQHFFGRSGRRLSRDELQVTPALVQQVFQQDAFTGVARTQQQEIATVIDFGQVQFLDLHYFFLSLLFLNNKDFLFLNNKNFASNDMATWNRRQSPRLVPGGGGGFGGVPIQVGKKKAPQFPANEWQEIEPQIKDVEQWFYGGTDFYAFIEPPAGKKDWTTWAYLTQNGRPCALLYRDSRDFMELYHLATWADVDTQFKIATESFFDGTKIIVDQNILNNGPLLANARACLFKLVPRPSQSMLDTLVATLANGNAEEACKQSRKPRAEPKTNGVLVTTKNVDATSLVKFIDNDPDDTNTTWMQWGQFKNSQNEVFLYKDMEKFEVYYTKANEGAGSELVTQIYDESFAVEGIEIPDDTTLKKLQLARTCLYKHKGNKIDASPEELQDMIHRMRNNKADVTNVVEFSNAMYESKAKVKKTDWFWRPASGTPKMPKFYFNPKPLRDGPQSTHTEFVIGTLEDISKKK
jgi:hypothetical protein